MGGLRASAIPICLLLSLGKIYPFVIFWENLHETSVASRAVHITCVKQVPTSVIVPSGNADTAGSCWYETEAVS